MVRNPSVAPYVTGPWVRGADFYGRDPQIVEIFDGPRDTLWLLGSHGIGKTSLLKQLEHLAAGSASDPSRAAWFPLFWDLEGACDRVGLADDFREALFDAEFRLAALGLDAEELAGDDLFESLGRLRRALRHHSRRLLLLIDEAEEMLEIGERDPALPRRLRRALTGREGMRVVIASSLLLWDLAGATSASPFLADFSPPLYVAPLVSAEARALVLQTHLPETERPRITAAVAGAICRRTASHPFFLQLVARRYLELGDVDEACAAVAFDPLANQALSLDFSALPATDRSVVRFLAEHGETTLDTLETALARHVDPGSDVLAALSRLLQIGMVRLRGERHFELSNAFFGQWLRETEPTSRVAGRGGDGFGLGAWRVWPRLNMLQRDGERDPARVHLEPRVMDLLVFLARHASRVVSKEEILAEVWENRVVSDAALARAVADLRKALGDDAHRQRIIATVTKRGYRLVGSVDWGLGPLSSTKPQRFLKTRGSRLS